MNAWRLLSRPEFCEHPVMDYVKMLWEDKDDLLMAYFKAIETEWRFRSYKSNLPLEAFENHSSYDIPEEWKDQRFIDSHRLMHNRLYKAYYSTNELQLDTDINQVLLNPYKLAEGILESPELPDFLQNPRYCQYNWRGPNHICDASDFSRGRCNLLLKPGQDEVCKNHFRELFLTKKCAHIMKSGHRCYNRCTLEHTFCTVHRKYIEDEGKEICDYEGVHGECIRHTFENSKFCRLHGGKPKKSEKNKEPKQTNKKRKLGSKGKEPESPEIDDRPMKADHIPNSVVIEKFEVRGYEITKFQDTPSEIKVTYRKL